MQPYKYFEHTADIKFRAYGKTLEEAFSNAALALTNIMYENKTIKNKIKKEITVEGKDLKALLYNFLEEFLFLMDSEGFLLNKIIKIKIIKEKNNYKLSAEITGDKASEQYQTHGDVKAITYNEMEIIRGKNKCMVQVVVDV